MEKNKPFRVEISTVKQSKSIISWSFMLWTQADDQQHIERGEKKNGGKVWLKFVCEIHYQDISLKPSHHKYLKTDLYK